MARLVAYIHNNPVRAGVVKSPEDSDWTPHRAYMGLCEPPPWLDVEWTLAASGFSASPAGRLAFHDYVCSRSELPRDPVVAGAGPLDTDMTRTLLRIVARRYELSESSLRKPGRQAEAKEARALLLHVAREVFGATATDLARELGVTTSTLTRSPKNPHAMTPPARSLVTEIVDEALEASAAGRQGAGKI